MISRTLLMLLCGSTLAGPVVAGSLVAPAAPGDAASAMYTLGDLYNRLNAGTAGALRSGSFVEPTAGPTAGTGRTLNEIMAKMPPAIDTTTGAGVADVLVGKTFWGLVSGAWGVQTGTVAAGADVIGANGSLSMAIPVGLYPSSKFATAGDTNLVAGNIKDSVNVFGLRGTYTGPSVPFPAAKTGDATENGGNPRGATWPTTRFTDNGTTVTVTVTDNLTGLVWLKDAHCFGDKTWDSAQTAVAALASPACGLNDGSTTGQWRLPSRNTNSQ